MTTATQSKKPTKQFRDGRVVVSLWKNETENGPRFGITVARLFKRTDDSEWEFSPTLNEGDGLKAGELLREAHAWIRDHRQES